MSNQDPVALEALGTSYLVTTGEESAIVLLVAHPSVLEHMWSLVYDGFEGVPGMAPLPQHLRPLYDELTALNTHWNAIIDASKSKPLSALCTMIAHYHYSLAAALKAYEKAKKVTVY